MGDCTTHMGSILNHPKRTEGGRTATCFNNAHTFINNGGTTRQIPDARRIAVPCPNQLGRANETSPDVAVGKIELDGQ